MPVRIASWNVNSVRLRVDGVRKLAADHAPDILCLQEIKVAEALFPYDLFTELGYPHHLVYGQKGYHGVAILSRLPLDNSGRRDWWNKQEGRHVHAEIAGGIELHNFYIPAGGDVPDPKKNDKFAHKLGVLAELAKWSKSRRKRGRQILVGDLNIAPLESDVWSHKQLLKVVSHTPVEVAALDKLMQAGDWVDGVRHFIPAAEKLYSWWSYRARDWDAADKGRRLDHIWVTPDLVDNLTGAQILRAARGWDKPSDHVPVIADLDI